MTIQTIPKGMIAIEHEYVIKNIPEGTTKIVIPKGVKRINWNTFAHYRSLQTVVIPESVESIGQMYSLAAQVLT